MTTLVLQCALEFEPSGDEAGFRAVYSTMGGLWGPKKKNKQFGEKLKLN